MKLSNLTFLFLLVTLYSCGAEKGSSDSPKNNGEEVEIPVAPETSDSTRHNDGLGKPTHHSGLNTPGEREETTITQEEKPSPNSDVELPEPTPEESEYPNANSFISFCNKTDKSLNESISVQMVIKATGTIHTDCNKIATDLKESVSLSLVGPEKKDDQEAHIFTTELLRGLSNLSQLEVKNSSVLDFTPLSELKTLESLSLEKNDTINGLEKLDFLSSLKVYNPKTFDTYTISGLVNLKQLTLIEARLKSFSILEGLVNLTYLDLDESKEKLENAEPLRKLTNLQNLFIYTEDLEDLEFIENLVNLKELDISYYDGAGSLNALSNLHNLEILYLDGIWQHSLLPLTNLRNIKKLHIEKTKYLENMNVINNFLNLEYLTLQRTSIDYANDTINLGELTKLRYLNLNLLETNANFSFENWNKLENLEYLDISALTQGPGSLNPIKDLSFIKDCINLKTILIWGGNFDDISYLYKLVNLEQFQLYATKVKNIDVISQFKKLKILDISSLEAKVTSLRSLRYLDQLEQFKVYRGDINKNEIDCPKTAIAKPVAEFCKTLW